MYAIGELTHTSTYIRKEGNDLGEQGPKGRNPQKVDNVYTFSTRVIPYIHPFYLHGRVRRLTQ